MIADHEFKNQLPGRHIRIPSRRNNSVQASGHLIGFVGLYKIRYVFLIIFLFLVPTTRAERDFALLVVPAPLLPKRSTLCRLMCCPHSCFRMATVSTGATVKVMPSSAGKLMHTVTPEGFFRPWAYLSVNWYRPGKWQLWARSEALEVPILRTTMIVESHWRKVKHGRLHQFNRPRAGLVVWILCACHYIPYVSYFCTSLISRTTHTYKARKGIDGWTYVNILSNTYPYI